MLAEVINTKSHQFNTYTYIHTHTYSQTQKLDFYCRTLFCILSLVSKAATFCTGPNFSWHSHVSTQFYIITAGKELESPRLHLNLPT